MNNENGQTGENLRALLQKHGLTQAELAEKLTNAGYNNGKGITTDAISKYVTGKRKITANFMKAVLEILGEKDLNVFFNHSSNKSAVELRILGKINCGIIPKDEVLNPSYIYIAHNEYKPSLKAVIASGNQMSPIIDDGDIIVYDEDKKSKITHGDIVIYKIYEEQACKVLIEMNDINILEFKPIETNENFKSTALRADDKYIMERLEMYKVVKIDKKLQNKKALLKLIKED